MGIYTYISKETSKQDLYGTKLDRIEETINKLGESILKDGVIENLEKK